MGIGNRITKAKQVKLGGSKDWNPAEDGERAAKKDNAIRMEISVLLGEGVKKKEILHTLKDNYNLTDKEAIQYYKLFNGD